jgi:hypothetical protein
VINQAIDELTLHSDRGSPMTAKPTAHLLVDLRPSNLIVGLTRATTTRTRNHNSEPSITAPTSPTDSAVSRTPDLTVVASSAGTTLTIATRASGITPQPASTTGGPRRSETNGVSSSSMPTPNTLNGSSARFLLRRPFRRSRGSTSRSKRRTPSIH